MDISGNRMLRLPASDALQIACYWETNHYPAEYRTDAHIHENYEIIVYLSGNMSYMVEGQIFMPEKGDVIFTRPNEYHQTIFHGETAPSYFCMHIPPVVDPQLPESMLAGNPSRHFIRVPAEEKKQLIDLCRRIWDKDERKTPLDKLYLFYSFLFVIQHAPKEVHAHQAIPTNLSRLLLYANENFATISNMDDLARQFYMTHNTLNRLFRKHLGISPHRYIENVRLAHAKSLLRSSKSVAEACYESGFADYSAFILKFRRAFGVTPLKYKQTGLTTGVEDRDK